MMPAGDLGPTLKDACSVQGDEKVTVHKAVLVAVALMTAGCTLGSSGSPGRHPTGSTFTESPVVPSSHPAARVVGCALASGRYTSPRTAADIVVGPVLFPGAKNMADSSPEAFLGGDVPRDRYGNYFVKVAVVVKADATVTVAIDRPAQSYVMLRTQRSPEGGEAAVTFQGCSQFDVAWAGGFLLKGRTRACVPLAIFVDGEAAPRALTVSLFNGPCPKSTG